MKLLFYGCAASAAFVTEKRASVAANKFQLGLIKAMHSILGDHLEVLSRVPIGSALRKEKLLIKRGAQTLFQGFDAQTQPMLNLPIVKQIWVAVDLLISVRRWYKKGSNIKEQKILMLYNINTMPIFFAYLAKRACKRLKVVYIFTEPLANAHKSAGLKKILLWLDTNLTKYSLKKFDAGIVLSEAAAHDYMQGKPYILIEGGLELAQDECEGQKPQASAKNSIIFSGALTEYNGVQLLIDAAKYMKNENCCIEFYGDGPLRAVVESMERAHANIHYYGQIENQELLRRQRNAAFLISPRPKDLPIVQYSFPSKIIEYMSSGVPVISTELSVYSQDLKEHLILTHNDTPESIAHAIDKALEMTQQQRKEWGERARAYAFQTFDWQIQAQKIIGFLEETFL